MLHRLYLPLPAVDGIDALEDNPFRSAGEVYTLYAEHWHKLATTDYVTARNPLPDDASTLRFPDGTPVIVVRRLTTDHDTGQLLAMEKPSAAPTTLNSPTRYPCPDVGSAPV